MAAAIRLPFISKKATIPHKIPGKKYKNTAGATKNAPAINTKANNKLQTPAKLATITPPPFDSPGSITKSYHTPQKDSATSA
jgi:hypothetical protein